MKSQGNENIQNQKILPQWKDIKPHILEYAWFYLHNEDVQKSKTLSKKIKELSQIEVDNHEQIVKSMLGY